MMMGLSRIMVAFSDPSLMRDFSSRTIGIANRECAVEPPSSSKPAMPELATAMAILPCKRMDFSRRLRVNVLPQPPALHIKKALAIELVLDSCHYFVEDVLLVGVRHWQHFFHLFLKAFLVIIEFCHS